MILDVPIKNQDGSLAMTLTLDGPQTQALLQFAINFLASSGLAAAYGIPPPSQPTMQ
jgi:hypothetical protein